MRESRPIRPLASNLSLEPLQHPAGLHLVEERQVHELLRFGVLRRRDLLRRQIEAELDARQRRVAVPQVYVAEVVVRLLEHFSVLDAGVFANHLQPKLAIRYQAARAPDARPDVTLDQIRVLAGPRSGRSDRPGDEACLRHLHVEQLAVAQLACHEAVRWREDATLYLARLHGGDRLWWAASRDERDLVLQTELFQTNPTGHMGDGPEVGDSERLAAQLLGARDRWLDVDRLSQAVDEAGYNDEVAALQVGLDDLLAAGNSDRDVAAAHRGQHRRPGLDARQADVQPLFVEEAALLGRRDRGQSGARGREGRLERDLGLWLGFGLRGRRDGCGGLGDSRGRGGLLARRGGRRRRRRGRPAGGQPQAEHYGDVGKADVGPDRRRCHQFFPHSFSTSPLALILSMNVKSTNCSGLAFLASGISSAARSMLNWRESRAG